MNHHLCIQEEYITFDGELIPFGKNNIEKENTKVINEILDMIIPNIGNGVVIVCGEGDAKRMLGRKLEDRLKRVVSYE